MIPKILRSGFRSESQAKISVNSNFIQHRPGSAQPSKPAEWRASGRRSGSTLLETVISIGITAFAVTALYVSAAQAVRIVKSGKEIVYASEMLQQRFESLRTASQKSWTSILTPSGTISVSALVTSATSAGAPDSSATSNFTKTTETYTVSAYPPSTPASSTPSFTVTVSNGSATFTGNALPSTVKCVKLTGQASWRSLGGIQRSRTLSTILTKGGF